MVERKKRKEKSKHFWVPLKEGSTN